MLNLVGAGGLIGKVLPILKVIGVDPSKMVNKFGRDQMAPLFDAAVPKVVARMDKDGITPAAKAADPTGERQFIRSAMYLLAKEVFASKLPKGANIAADFLRDQHDDQVVATCSPKIDPTMTTRAAVEIVKHEFFERIN